MKSVRFNEIVTIYPTYSIKDYDRYQIDSVLYKKSYNRISIKEWNSILIILDLFKLYEMRIHPNSLKNNSYRSTFQHFFE